MKRLIALSFIGAALLLAGCGSSKKSSTPNTFVLSEFTITPPTNAVHAGKVLLVANNVGREMHELVIVRAASDDTLATNADGSVDESKLRGPEEVGVIDSVAASSRKSERFEMTAGTYVAFCNLIDNKTGTPLTNGFGIEPDTGNVHFALGMHVTFTVR